jgi:hypothetical protein
LESAGITAVKSIVRWLGVKYEKRGADKTT